MPGKTPRLKIVSQIIKRDGDIEHVENQVTKLLQKNANAQVVWSTACGQAYLAITAFVTWEE